MDKNTISVLLLSFSVIPFLLSLYTTLITHKEKRGVIFLLIFLGLIAAAGINYFQTNGENNRSDSFAYNNRNSNNNPIANREPSNNPEETKVLPNAILFDVDHNAYETIRIGDQIWMKQNLRTSRFQDGSSILEVEDSLQWGDNNRNSHQIGEWCYYDGSSSYNSTLGKLYNWYAINDKRGVCPKGWHVPDTLEWRRLINYLGGNSVAGAAIKADTSLWLNANGENTNTSKFTCFPSGGCTFYGGTTGLGIYANYWCSTPMPYPTGPDPKHYDSWAFDVIIRSNSSEAIISNTLKPAGFPCRCLKDN